VQGCSDNVRCLLLNLGGNLLLRCTAHLLLLLLLLLFAGSLRQCAVPAAQP
jgi:hypothetical protein